MCPPPRPLCACGPPTDHDVVRMRLQSQLLKRSDHVKEWRSRYFHLHDRRIYYFECEDDAMPKDGKTFHKGYLDMVRLRWRPLMLPLLSASALCFTVSQAARQRRRRLRPLVLLLSVFVCSFFFWSIRHLLLLCPSLSSFFSPN